MITLYPLEEKHLEDAAGLFVSGFKSLREKVPALPDKYLNCEAIIPRLKTQLERSEGVAAFNGASMAGYMIGMRIPRFFGSGDGIYCPEWGHSTIEPDSAEIYSRMYAGLSPYWVADNCFTHAITFLAHRKNDMSRFYWLGFGLLTIDAIRLLEPSAYASPPGVKISRAEPGDVEAVVHLERGLQRHLADTPIFLACDEPPNPESLSVELAQGDKKIWLAWSNNVPVAFIQSEPSTFGAAQIVESPDKVAITGAYTLPEYRGQGIGAALLNTLLADAAKNGAQRCSVDFETANAPARTFWLKHFSPVCYSAIRRLNENIITTNHRFDIYRKTIGELATLHKN